MNTHSEHRAQAAHAKDFWSIRVSHVSDDCRLQDLSYKCITIAKDWIFEILNCNATVLCASSRANATFFSYSRVALPFVSKWMTKSIVKSAPMEPMILMPLSFVGICRFWWGDEVIRAMMLWCWWCDLREKKCCWVPSPTRLRISYATSIIKRPTADIVKSTKEKTYPSTSEPQDTMSIV